MSRMQVSVVALALGYAMGAVQVASAQGWEPMWGCAPVAPDPIRVEIIEPGDPTKVYIDPGTLLTDSVTLRARVMRGSQDVTSQTTTFGWTLQHSWCAALPSHQYSSEDIVIQTSDNPTSRELEYWRGCFPEGDFPTPQKGRIKVHLKVVFQGKEYRAQASKVVLVAGRNPTHAQASTYFPDDLMRALAWSESEWKQYYGDNGKPRLNTGGSPPAYAWGLMQISERAHPEYDYRNVAWHWGANISYGVQVYQKKLEDAQRLHSTWSQTGKENCAISYYKGYVPGSEAEAAYYASGVRGYVQNPPW